MRQRQQTIQTVQQICERSAAVLAARLRQHFEAAVLDTLAAIGHPALKAYDLEHVDRYFGNGVAKHPYIDRFFFWNAGMPDHFQREVLFYRPGDEAGARHLPIVTENGGEVGALFSEPHRGRELLDLVVKSANARRSFGVAEYAFDGVPHQVVFHLLWDDAEGTELFALVGYIVDFSRLRRELFPALLKDGLLEVLNPHANSVQLTLTVKDHTGVVVYGPPPPIGVPAATEPLEMLFFPRQAFRHWVVSDPRASFWTLTVSATNLPPSAGNGYLLLAAVVSLLLVAVICAVLVDRQAVRLSELQADFVANVSHQLRTPLALLSGAAETLRLGRVRSPEKLEQYADIVRAQAQRLTVLVEQILHFSRADVGGAEYASERVNLTELTTRLVDEFRASDLSEREDGQSFRLDLLTDGAPVFVCGDGAAIEQAILNLLENAVKYGGSGNVVTVTVSSTSTRAIVAVKDRGPGIPAGDLPHIFDKFYRSRAGVHGRRGFGLGLAVVRAVVRAHGGHVSVESAVGRGSEFKIVLPRGV